MKNVILATTNPGKILEYQTLFKELKLPINLITLKDAGIFIDIEEDGKTFEENAIKKANSYSTYTDLPVLAEDGGLEIDYLNGEPGVYSRRWPGYEATDKELLDILFEKMKGVPRDKRGAQFKVVVALKISKDNDPILAEGSLRGQIEEEVKSSIIPGFPFRSVFYLESIGKTLGEVTMEEEAKIAHRRMALNQLILEFLKI